MLWREAVATQAIKLNQFAVPLDGKETLGIGKSVAKWVWARDAEAEATFIARQKPRAQRVVRLKVP